MGEWTLKLTVDADTVSKVARNARSGSYHTRSSGVATIIGQVQKTVMAVRPPKADGLVDIRVDQYSRTAHHRDSDNVSGPAKAIIDGLEKAGVIGGDCPCHVLDVTLRQHNGQGDVPEGVHEFVVTVTPTETGA